jgi:toluene monooxygenase system protein E
MAAPTFEHLQGGGRRRPDAYEEVSAFMQWGETFRGKFPDLPHEGVYYHYPPDYKLGYWDPSKTAWKSERWETFRDPYRLTYRSYHEIQSEREAALDAVLSAARAENAIRLLDEEWVAVLRLFFAPMRFAEWGISMAHQYVGRFAISGLIANCAALQWFDELRHTQRIAEWTRDLEAAHGGFADYRRQWLEDELFQPLREYIERVCVCQDWGEVIVSTNLVLEPLLQPVLYAALSQLGTANRDSVLPHFAYSIFLDEERHWGWARALETMLREESEANAELTHTWRNRWQPLAERAVTAFRPVFGKASGEHVFDRAYAEASAEVRKMFEPATIEA